jgi:predicted RNA binding protein YcfA (HicA-like mRNA interferase family)
MKVREFIKLIEKDGWLFLREGKGSHTIYQHPTKKGTIPVPIHGGDIPTGTLNAMLKQAGLKRGKTK